MSVRRRLFLALLVPLLFSSPVACEAPPTTTTTEGAVAPTDVEWRAHGRTPAEQRYSPLDQITVDNVTGQQHLCQLVLQASLNDTFKRPCPEYRVVALIRQPLQGRVR